MHHEPGDPTRFTISVERTVNLGNYESIRVGLAESFDVGSISRDEAYRRVLQEVQAWAGSLKPAGMHLGDAWSEVNAVVRSLGGKWQRGSESTDDSWRIPK